ncbi:MAG TPA: PKD domain-containing protein, partial [Gemmatimonadales bacterium]|nr:PKD domain-containing protein [Gemmatimonadales bacterium]
SSFAMTNLSVGTHTITLTATDSDGATGTASLSIAVTAPVPANQPPVANFTWAPTGLKLHQIAFDGTSSTDDVGIVSWVWTLNMGGGKVYTINLPSFRESYPASGTYNVTLTVTDGGGLTSSITKQILVP